MMPTFLLQNSLRPLLGIHLHRHLMTQRGLSAVPPSVRRDSFTAAAAVLFLCNCDQLWQHQHLIVTIADLEPVSLLLYPHHLPHHLFFDLIFRSLCLCLQSSRGRVVTFQLSLSYVLILLLPLGETRSGSSYMDERLTEQFTFFVRCCIGTFLKILR